MAHRVTLPKIRAGKSVYIPWEVTTGHPPVAFDPVEPPLISIADPSGVVKVSAQPTIKESAGLYFYIYATPVGGPLGVWTAWLDADDSGSLKLEAFELV